MPFDYVKVSRRKQNVNSDIGSLGIPGRSRASRVPRNVEPAAVLIIPQPESALKDSILGVYKTANLPYLFPHHYSNTLLVVKLFK